MPTSIGAVWLTVPQIAEHLATNYRRILKEIHGGELRAYNIAPPGSNRPTWRVKPEDFEDWLAGRRHAAKTYEPPRRRRDDRQAEAETYFGLSPAELEEGLVERAIRRLDELGIGDEGTDSKKGRVVQADSAS